MKGEIKAVIFDVGGVLAIDERALHKKGHVNIGVHEYVAKKTKVSLDQYFDAIDTNYARSTGGLISREKVVEVLSKNLKITPKKLEKIYKRAYKKNFKQNKQLFKQAFNLKKRGYTIAVLSDQWHLSKETLMPVKLYKNFDLIVVSCDVGFRKPNPKIYKLLLSKLKLPARDCLFIDNQEWNIKPAKKLGFKTILFENNKQVIDEIEKILK